MWTARVILFGVLVVLTGIDLYLLRRRPRHERLIENQVFNVLAVTVWNACCYLIAALPPAAGWEQRPLWLVKPGILVGFAVVGSVLMGPAVLLFVVAVGQRRVLGIQDVPAGLLTSGVYRCFRHPIYVGILWMSLGLALLTRNPDGLLMFPALLGLFVVQALIEERCDMGVRFPEQYRQYKRAVWMFGPAWLWGTIVAALVLIVVWVNGPAATGRWLRTWLTAGRIHTDGVTSYYVCSGARPDHAGKLPAIIFIGHPLSSPFRDLAVFKGWFDEPVLLIWSGVVSDIREGCPVEDEPVWARKRQQFLRLLDDYQRKLPVDESRIYLTGFSLAGVYAWMLAYDRPELYAAVVPMSATSYPRQIQEHLEAAKTLVTVVVRGEKDDTPPRDLAAETRTGRIVESCNPGSRFVLKAGEGHHDMHKYWRENLQYVLQFRKRDDNKMMTKNSGSTARSSSEAFLAWARRSAILMPASHDEPRDASAQAALERMLGGKRFVFLGEPEHCIVEKYPFRLTLIRYLFARGWRHVAMETGRSMGWRVDRYLATGDTSHLVDVGVERLNPQDRAIHGRILEFIKQKEEPFHEQLRCISESREQGTPRLRYWGYDLDLGMALGSVEPMRHLLEGYTDRRVQELLNSINTLTGLSVEEQLTRIEELWDRVATREDILSDDTLGELQSWLSLLHDSVAAEKRPRMTQDRHGHHVWRGQREHSMMQYLDQIVDIVGDDKLILMGHNGHLSKDASGLRFRPQLSRFWGWCSWFRAVGHEAFSRLTRCPLDIGTPDGSVGSHLHERFPGQVLSIWMLYGQGTLMMPGGPRTVRLHGDTVESLLAQIGDRFLLPLSDVDPQARAVLSNANVRTSWGYYASADLTAQADAIYFVREVNAK
jgi:protein-S-isoprenylcysteine O-methyltransferase Ste14/erythromycin esterase-like protein